MTAVEHGEPGASGVTEALSAVPEEAPRLGLLERLADARAEIEAQALELRCQIPTWNGDLVGVFTLLSKQEKADVKKRMKHPDRASLSKDDADQVESLDVLATACRSIHYEGELVPGAPTGSAFSSAFGEAVKAKRRDGKPGEPSDVDILWKVLRCRIEPFNALNRVVGGWMANPRPLDMSDSDPFGLG